MPQERQGCRLIMVGACYIDTILTAPYFPSEDAKLRATSLERRRGGNCANSLEVLQQLPPPSTLPRPSLHLISVLPAASSASAAFIASSFPSPSPSSSSSTLLPVDLGSSIHRPQHTEAASSFIVKSAATGSRTIVNYNALRPATFDELRGRLAPLLADDEGGGGGGGNDPSAIRRRVLIHFEGRETDVALETIRWLRSREGDGEREKVMIGVEVEKPGREGLREMAAEADVVFFSRSWAEHEGYDGAEACLRGERERLAAGSGKRTPLLVFCTWGERGAAVMRVGDGWVCSEPARVREGREVVDTVGAGDTFVAGVLGVLAHGASESCDYDDDELRKTLQFANLLAGKKVVQEGFKNVVGGDEYSLFRDLT